MNCRIKINSNNMQKKNKNVIPTKREQLTIREMDILLTVEKIKTDNIISIQNIHKNVELKTN